jgi:hypothetical protein
MHQSLTMMVVAMLAAAFAMPALAEQRWLACKFTDQTATARNFFMMFDDIRNTASLFDGSGLVEGSSTSITFQALRTRFPNFAVTYNRNDGALAVTGIAGTYGGSFAGECRRSPPPPGVPAG